MPYGNIEGAFIFDAEDAAEYSNPRPITDDVVDCLNHQSILRSIHKKGGKTDYIHYTLVGFHPFLLS